MLEDILITKCWAQKIVIMEYVTALEIEIAGGLLRVRRRQNSPKGLVF